MTVVTLAADTWGIPSKQFLLGYLLTAIAAVIGSVVLRGVYLRGISRAQNPGGVLTPAEMGMLFGDRRAVLAALAQLRSVDLIDSSGHATRQLTSQDRDLDPFTRSVHDRLAAAGPQNIVSLTRSLTVPLAQLRESLVRRGLLTGPAQRQAARMAAVPIFVVLVVGLARIVAGIANDKPVWGLVAIVVPLGLVGWFLARTRRRSGRGTVELFGALGRTPRGHRYDRTNPGLAAALGGGAAFFLFDAGLAGATGVSSTDDSGGGFWSSAVGDSGSSSSDSGSSSSCSSGSSCGGGGGCGGGCGG